MTTESHVLQPVAPPISNARLGMLLFVASEVMLFAGLVAGYVVLDHGSAADAMRALPFGLAPVALAILVASSAALAMAQRSAREGSAAASRLSLLSLLLGAAFLTLQALDWSALLGARVLPESAINAGMLYVAGGVHALHVVVGLVLLAILAVRTRRDPRSERSRTAAAITGLYWHVVTTIWLALFLMLYIL